MGLRGRVVNTCQGVKPYTGKLHSICMLLCLRIYENGCAVNGMCARVCGQWHMCYGSRQSGNCDIVQTIHYRASVTGDAPVVNWEYYYSGESTFQDTGLHGDSIL